MLPANPAKIAGPGLAVPSSTPQIEAKPALEVATPASAHAVRAPAAAPRDTDPGRPELSIAIPCLNEAETIAACVASAVRCLRENHIEGEVVVGDNGSTDGSQELARRAGARVVPVPRRGYGSALMGAIEASRGTYVVMGDSDGSHDFAEAVTLLHKLREGYDLVMGNRFRGGIMPGAMSWKNRWVGNPVLTGIGRLVYRAPVADFHCGLRGFTRSAYDALRLRTTGMEFASEMVIKATVARLRIAEVPITMHKDGRSRPPHLRPWRDGWRHLRFMLLLSPRWTLVYPGLGLTLLGLAIGLPLAMGLDRVGNVQLGPHTLAGAGFMILVGYTALTVGIAARVYAMQEELGPPSSPFVRRLTDLFSLERGLLAGGALVISGLAILAYLVARWLFEWWGAMPLERTIRPMLVGGTMVALGVQTVLMSFFYSMLAVPLRHAR